MSDQTDHAHRRVLLHVCCAACWAAVVEDLTQQNIDYEGLFYNPNIHPLIEFRRRLKACKVFAHDLKLPLTVDEDYGLVGWLRQVVGHEDRRCDICYRMRLTQTARTARERGFDAFSTTLLVSPHQKHERLHRIGQQVADEVGCTFLYRDWRPLFESGHAQAQRRNLYLQQYCGCVYSEYERYKNTTRHLWRPPAGT